ncbi:MAG: GNAT family N-acetyltransferase [Nannocystaceae bacterium]
MVTPREARRPEDLPLRDAREADAPAIARVHVTSQDDAYAPLAAVWPTPDLDDRAARWARWLGASRDPARVYLVAEVDGAVVGFISAGPARREDAGAEVEVYVLHVLPPRRGQGIGRALWSAACARVRGPELRALCVETFAELRCCAFYEARGGEPIARAPDKFHGGDVTRIVYGWPVGRSSE